MITRGYKGLEEVKTDYRRLQEVTRGYKRLQGITRGYKRLQGVTGGYIEDITRWREDMNFIFEWQNNILRTSAASE